MRMRSYSTLGPVYRWLAAIAVVLGAPMLPGRLAAQSWYNNGGTWTNRMPITIYRQPGAGRIELDQFPGPGVGDECESEDGQWGRCGPTERERHLVHRIGWGEAELSDRVLRLGYREADCLGAGSVACVDLGERRYGD